MKLRIRCLLRLASKFFLSFMMIFVCLLFLHLNVIHSISLGDYLLLFIFPYFILLIFSLLIYQYFFYYRRVGVNSYREYEEKHLKQGEAHARRKMEVAAQVARVKNQLEYEQRSDPEADVTKKETELEELDARLKELEKEKAKHEEAAKVTESELAGLSEKSGELKKSMDEMDGVIKDLRKKASAAGDSGMFFKDVFLRCDGEIFKKLTKFYF